jgi:PAS domain S-box-containing protein
VRILLIFLSLLFFIPNASAQEEKKINILYLNSYHNGYQWSDSIFDGVRDTFRQSGKNIYLQIEYMDSKRFSGKKINDILHNYYKFKFRTTHFDLIVTSDNNAYEFMSEHGDELFPNVPIVFCGINDVEAGAVPMRSRMTGLLEEFDVPSNIEMALKFHPGKRRLVVIGDRSLTGVAIANQVRAQLHLLPPGIQVEFLDDFTLEELISKVRFAAGDSIFFFIPFYKDVGEAVYSAQDLLKIVWEQTGAPLYGAWEFLLGHGLVGGKLISGYAHGQAAAKMGLRILDGASPADIPISVSPDEPPKFDYRVLMRLGINRKLLPEGSILINEPSPFYSINRHQFWTIIISLVILSMVLVLLVINILERKQIEVRIKNQLSFLRTLMDTLPVPIYFTDRSGAIAGINRSFENWFGVNWQQDRAFASQELAVADSRFSPMLDTRMDSFDSQIQHGDGTLRSVVLHKATYSDAQGDNAGIVGVIYDISDRKKAEDDLRAAEEKYRTIFENSALGIFQTTPDGSWIVANPALARMLGYASPEDLTDANPNIASLYYQHSDRERVVELYQQNRGSIEFEVLFRRRDGAVITANLNARAVRGSDDDFCHFEGFVEDITDRKAAELALAASEAMLQLVLDTIPQLVHWKDKRLRIIGANRNFLTHVGETELSAVLGKTYAEVLTNQEEIERVAELDRRVIRLNEPCYRMRMETRNAAGERMWLLVNKVPLYGAHGDVVGILSTAEDITQTMSLEKQLLQSQKMEAIGTLAGGIAHDFNNILTSIMNSTELAMEDIEEYSIAWKDLERCLKAAARGSGLIKQILTFSRPTQEGFVPTDLREVVSEAVALIRVSMPRNITVESGVEKDLPLCLADPTQVHQIVMNLATNAFQALGSRGGTIRISLGRLILEREEPQWGNLVPGAYSLLSIEDNGPGIAESIQDKIYDPFFTTKGKGEGTGLGLAVVHGIVRNHGGGIRLTSAPGKTRFDILLPTMNDFCLLPGECDSDVAEGTEHVAFIEDDEDQLQLIPRVLAQLGYTVHPFHTATEAIEVICGGLELDLVITDFDMPGMTGIDVAVALEECRPELPVIMVSGRKRAAEFSSLAGNIRFFVSKPYNKNMLGRAIRDVMDKDA